MEKRSMDLAEALPLARAGHAGRVATALLAEMDRRAEEITELGNNLVTASRRVSELESASEPTEIEVGALAHHLRNLMNGGVADSEHIARSFLGYLGVVGMRQELAYLRSRVEELEKVDQRAKDARRGSHVDGEPEYESGWLAAANYIHGASK